MELQNIVFDFKNNNVYSLYSGTNYQITSVSNLSLVKSNLDAQAGFSVDVSIIQYTIDQHGDVPRIISKTIPLDPLEESQHNITNISNSSVDLVSAINAAKTEIEADITNQIG